MNSLHVIAVDENTRLAQSDHGKRITMKAADYNALQKQLDLAMAEVYAERLGEIPDAEPGKGYSNSIVAARLYNTRMFNFGQAHLPYLIVSDRFSVSGYGSDHSVSIERAFACVQADSRRTNECVWDIDAEFGVEGRHKLNFGELTVEAARKVANGMVDCVRDHMLAVATMESLPYKGKVLPFMTVVPGHVLIHDGDTGATLPDSWTGICVDATSVSKYWYVGRSRGERSFCALASKDTRAAILESQLFVKFENDGAVADNLALSA